LPEIYSNTDLIRILRNVDTIAMVGASAKWQRPSYFAMKYLQEKGYRVPGPFQMVDVFRGSDAAMGITQDVISLKDEKSIEVIWMQLGVINDEAAALARAAGLEVVMNRCPKIEYGRLNAELSWGGFDSKVISAKRRKLS